VVKARLRNLRRVVVVVRFGKPFRLRPTPGLEQAAQLAAYDDEIMCRIAALLPPERRGAYADHPRLKELLSSQPLDAAPDPELAANLPQLDGQRRTRADPLHKTAAQGPTNTNAGG
jgi:1-acyl-sn-glycerol-3-phosphate acyltransferase